MWSICGASVDAVDTEVILMLAGLALWDFEGGGRTFAASCRGVARIGSGMSVALFVDLGFGLWTAGLDGASLDAVKYATSAYSSCAVSVKMIKIR